MLKIATILFLLIIMAEAAIAQDPVDSQDPWAPVRTLEGVWEGTGSGFGQTSRVTHNWQFVMGGKFFRLETKSISDTNSGEADVHEDVGYVSWSTGEELLRFRQFLSEGFVNTFKIIDVEAPESGLNFEPENTEGVPTLVVRMTLRFKGANAYEMVLEMSSKGKELKPCQTMQLRKVK
jgi:hypothetical protein